MKEYKFKKQIYYLKDDIEILLTKKNYTVNFVHGKENDYLFLLGDFDQKSFENMSKMLTKKHPNLVLLGFDTINKKMNEVL